VGGQTRAVAAIADTRIHIVSSVHHKGFVYVATGTAYLSEAFKSAESLRRHHPDVPVCLVTDNPPVERGPFTEIRRPVGLVRHSPVDKVLAYEAPYDRVVFLDTDTFVLDDLTPIFQLLDTFDLALLQDVNRGWNYELPDVPLSFSEFNTGVMAFRKSPQVAGFFAAWSREYNEMRDKYGFATDQPAFRRTLFHSELRVAPLPSEFHFLGDMPNCTLWNVRLIHGRGNHERIARQVNEELGLRAYVPEIGTLGKYHGRRKLLRDMVCVLCRMTTLLVRGGENVSANAPTKWWVGEGKQPKAADQETRD
jgi:hypothetical protein